MIKLGVTAKVKIISWLRPLQNYISLIVFNGIPPDMNVTRKPLPLYPFPNILSYQYNLGNIRAISLDSI